MELVIIFIIIFIIYGAGWIWQTINDILRDINRSNWDSRVYGQVTSSRSLKKTLGGQDLAELRKAYARFAENSDGQTHDRSPFESPKVSYVYKTSRVLLSIYESNDERPHFYTQLTFTIASGWPHRVEIFPQRFNEHDVRYLNVDDLEIGEPEFDRRFVIKANDAGFVKEFLDAPTRWAVDELRNMAGNDRILLSINSSRLMVRKQSVIARLDQLERFAQLSGQIYDRIIQFWQRANGIEIIDAPVDGRQDPHCQVCGTGIPPENCVYCRRCKTPHHPDCWSFNDGCSTYACGEKRFVKKY
ncbi:MAG: hypothetical protein HYY16_19355 [Planctomycetes bacterium]|nr:hypothetical protein [Planctomycetota bacterium]